MYALTIPRSLPRLVLMTALSLQIVFDFLGMPCNFVLISGHDVGVIGSAVIRPLVKWWQGVGRGSVLQSISRSQTSSEPMPLDVSCASASQVSPAFLGGTRWLEQAGVGYFLPPRKSGSDNTPAG